MLWKRTANRRKTARNGGKRRQTARNGGGPPRPGLAHFILWSLRRSAVPCSLSSLNSLNVTQKPQQNPLPTHLAHFFFIHFFRYTTQIRLRHTRATHFTTRLTSF